MRNLVVFGFLLAALSSHAATYFFDFAGGNDANNGLTQGAAKKRHFYMNGYSGPAYTHVAGDRFIFKGGSVWPASCFQWHLIQGGTTGNPDYYGTDQTWFSGGSWTRPLFDLQHVVLGPNASGAAIYVDANFSTTGWTVFDGLEIAHQRAMVTANAGSCSILFNFVDNCTVTNCIVRDWDMDAPPNNQESGSDGGIVLSVGTATNNTVTHCILNCAGSSMRTGSATRNINHVDFTEFYQVIEAILGGGDIVHDCHIHDMPAPTDPFVHNNAIETFRPSTIYNILIHDLDAHTTPINIAPDFITPGLASSNYVYNVTGWNLGGQTPIGLDTGGNPANSKFYIWNNTISDAGWIVRTANRGQTNAYGYVEMRNNQFITPLDPPWTFSPPNGAPVTTVVQDHNITQTPAVAMVTGYTIANQFQPTTDISPTVNVGTPISFFSADRLGVSRPQFSVWDVGAYELNGGFTPPPPATVPISISVGGKVIFSGNVQAK